MTQYEKIMSEMTIGKYIGLSVRYNRSCESWQTSDGHFFDKVADACQHELNYLKSEVEK